MRDESCCKTSSFQKALRLAQLMLRLLHHMDHQFSLATKSDKARALAGRMAACRRAEASRSLCHPAHGFPGGARVLYELGLHLDRIIV
jgi:hypothetical protein